MPSVPRRERVCLHENQSSAGTNQWQGMLKCVDCGKLMAQIYTRADKEQLKRMPVIVEVVRINCSR